MGYEEFSTAHALQSFYPQTQSTVTHAACGNKWNLAVRSLARRFCEAHPLLRISPSSVPFCLGWYRRTVLGRFKSLTGD
jgi:hypothetical protein